MSGSLILMYITFGVLLAVMIGFGIIRPLILRSNFDEIRDNIKVGMTEMEMVEKFGVPSKTITVCEEIKVVSYIYSHNRGQMYQPKSYQILIMIEDGIIKNFSM